MFGDIGLKTRELAGDRLARRLVGQTPALDLLIAEGDEDLRLVEDQTRRGTQGSGADGTACARRQWLRRTQTG
jgi:hypothetical protein